MRSWLLRQALAGERGLGEGRRSRSGGAAGDGGVQLTVRVRAARDEEVVGEVHGGGGRGVGGGGGASVTLA